MSDYSCNEHGKNYVEGCVACDFPQEFYALQDENAELKLKLAAAEKDAKRYRWLRDKWFIYGIAKHGGQAEHEARCHSILRLNESYVFSAFPAEFPWNSIEEELPDTLDAVIDEAMKDD